MSLQFLFERQFQFLFVHMLCHFRLNVWLIFTVTAIILIFLVQLINFSNSRTPLKSTGLRFWMVFFFISTIRNTFDYVVYPARYLIYLFKLLLISLISRKRPFTLENILLIIDWFLMFFHFVLFLIAIMLKEIWVFWFG